MKPGVMVNTWLAEMTAYVRGLTAHHMIATGEEGYKVSSRAPLHFKL